WAHSPVAGEPGAQAENDSRDDQPQPGAGGAARSEGVERGGYPDGKAQQAGGDDPVRPGQRKMGGEKGGGAEGQGVAAEKRGQAATDHARRPGARHTPKDRRGHQKFTLKVPVTVRRLPMKQSPRARQVV